jgi:predicted permease
MRVDNFVDWQTQARSFEAMAAYNMFAMMDRYSLTGVGESQRLRGVQVSQGFLDVLGVRLLLGRGFVDEECDGNGLHAAILSHAFWRQKFSGDTDVIGQSVMINGEPVTIVGVLPPRDNLDVLFSLGTNMDVLLPFPMTEEMARHNNILLAIGRLSPEATIVEAQNELDVINARLRTLHPERVERVGEFNTSLTPLNDYLRGSFRPAFLLLSSAVLCVLLIACINLSNLLLARAIVRRREFSVRIALGAGHWYLVRQTMIENLLLAFAGCLLGISCGSFAIASLAQLNAFSIPLLQGASIDTTVLLVAVALACLAAFLCSVLPVLQLWRRRAIEVLHDAGTRGNTRKGTVWIRRTLVISEIALACILLVGAGLLIRSFAGVLQVDLGFSPEHTFAWRVDTQDIPADQKVPYYDGLVERVSAVPGVESAGLSDNLPLGFVRGWGIEQVDGVVPNNNTGTFIWMVDDGYLQTLRITLHAGRYFDDRDSQESPRVTIISDTAAHNYWPGQNPIGRTVRMNNHTYTVVGVVADVANGLEETPESNMYLNMRQVRYWNTPELVVRSGLASAPLIANVRAAIREYDPALPSNEYTTLEQVIDRAIAPRRLITGILSSFSAFAFLLAAVGLYGVTAYSVGQRTQEIGIRLALGAQRGNVLGLVVGEGLRMAGIGVAIGLAASLFVTRLLQSQLYGVTTSDPFTYALTAAILVTVTLLACYVPARRAARIDPMEALRYE